MRGMPEHAGLWMWWNYVLGIVCCKGGGWQWWLQGQGRTSSLSFARLQPHWCKFISLLTKLGLIQLHWWPSPLATLVKMTPVACLWMYLAISFIPTMCHVKEKNWTKICPTVEYCHQGCTNKELPSAIGVVPASHHYCQCGILQECERGQDIADQGCTVHSDGQKGDWWVVPLLTDHLMHFLLSITLCM